MTLTLTFKTVLRSHQSWYHLEDTSVSIVEFFIIYKKLYLISRLKYAYILSTYIKSGKSRQLFKNIFIVSLICVCTFADTVISKSESETFHQFQINFDLIWNIRSTFFFHILSMLDRYTSTGYPSRIKRSHSSSTLFRNKRFVLYEMFQRNNSKFAIS